MTQDVMERDQVKAIVDVLELPELETLVVKWHHDRNLIEGSTDKDQLNRLVQEMGELSESICSQENPIDDLGDCLVVLQNIMERHNLTMTDCMRHAYKDIMHRTGRMVDGVFLKDEDLEVDDLDPQGWLPWGPGAHGYPECPLLDGTPVEVTFRQGMRTTQDNPETFRWNHADSPSDIVAFRRLSDKEDKFWDPYAWVSWGPKSPGYPKCPLPGGVPHEIELRSGAVRTSDAPSGWAWSHNNTRGDIVAFRRLPDE